MSSKKSDECLSLEKLLSTTPEELAEVQYNAIKKHIKDTLSRIIWIVDNEPEKIYDHLVMSPAGDGWGTEHHFIDFSFQKKQDEYDGRDIEEAVGLLLLLKNHI